jgi:lipopolysaccharide export system protein LptA
MKNLQKALIIPITILSTILSTPNLLANKKHTYSADTAERYTENNKQIIKLYGNVIYKSESLHITAEEAYICEEDNTIKATKNVKITKDDSTYITATDLTYNSKTQIAIINNIILQEKKAKITSNTCHYNTDNETATLTGNVKFEDDKTIMTCTHLVYDYAKNVISNTDIKMHQDIFGTLPNYRIYILKKRVNIYVKKNQTNIKGENGIYDKEKETLKIYGNAVLTKTLNNEKMYFKADKFLFLKDEVDKSYDILEASPQVKLYGKDLQGVTGRMIYTLKDSMIYLKNDPILWTENSQITSNEIKVKLKDDTIEGMYIEDQVVIVQENEIKHYNQIVAQTMEAHFLDNKINYILLKGNAESLYQLLDKNNLIIGINYVKSGEIKLVFKDQKIDQITFIGKSEGNLFPPKYKSHFKLHEWQGGKRPTLKDIIG